MTYAQVALQDFPVRLWTLDRAPFVDQTKFGPDAATTPLTNMVINPGFEANLSGWQGDGGSTITRDQEHRLFGSASLRWDTTQYSGLFLNPQPTGKSNVNYTASAWIKGSGTVQVRMHYFPTTGGSQVFATTENITLTNEWKRYYVTGNKPDVANVYFVLVQTSTTPQTVWVDGVMMHEGTAPVDYFDGSMTYKISETNWIHNPKAITTNGWLTGHTDGMVEVVDPDGKTWMRKPVSNGSGNWLYVFGTTRIGGYYSGRFTVRAAPGTQISTPSTDNVVGGVIAGTYHTIPASGILSITVPSASDPVSGEGSYIGIASDDQFDVTDVGLFRVDGPGQTTTGKYFDGSTPDSSMYNYLWTGAENNSPSVMSENGYTFAWKGAAHNSESTMQSPAPRHAALVKGATASALVGNSSRLNFDAPIMKRGREDQAFSIEVTFRPIKKEASNAAQQIFGTASIMDGLCIAGTVLSFTTKYTNTGEARCEFDLQEYRSVTVVAIHSSRKNTLYVNGDLVDEVEITDEQRADTYLSAGTSLSSGTSTSANLLALNGLAIYTHGLADADIEQHYDEASDNMDEFAVGAAFGGSVFALNSSTSIPLLEYTYTDDVHWQAGRFSGTIIEQGQIIPQSVGGVSMPGLWETIVPLPPDSTLSSITLDWQGEGETVQTSLDGNTWSTERRSARISTVSDGFDTTDKFLYLRVSFPGGKTNDKSYFDSLVITAYGPINTAQPALETRTLTMSNGSIEADFDITEYHENWGIELNNGSMSLSGASATAISPRTIQVWAKRPAGATFTDNLKDSATAWYTNDGTYQQEYQSDEWQLRTYIFPSGHALPITFTGTGQIGCILIYPYTMSSQQINDSYRSFTGSKATEFTTSGTIGFVDISNTVDIYEYDWSIETAG